MVSGSTGGLPEISEVVQMVVLEGNMSFIIKEFGAWYREHFRASTWCPRGPVPLGRLQDWKLPNGDT